MVFRLSAASLVSRRLAVDGTVQDGATIVVNARGATGAAACPACDILSRHIQGRCIHQPPDLPCAGWGVRLQVVVRRFLCSAPTGCDKPRDWIGQAKASLIAPLAAGIA